MVDMPSLSAAGCCDGRMHSGDLGLVYNSVGLGAEGINEWCKDHMKMLSREAAVLVLVVERS